MENFEVSIVPTVYDRSKKYDDKILSKMEQLHGISKI
jgi:hypothetical protein